MTNGCYIIRSDTLHFELSSKHLIIAEPKKWQRRVRSGRVLAHQTVEPGLIPSDDKFFASAHVFALHSPFGFVLHFLSPSITLCFTFLCN